MPVNYIIDKANQQLMTNHHMVSMVNSVAAPSTEYNCKYCRMNNHTTEECTNDKRKQQFYQRQANFYGNKGASGNNNNHKFKKKFKKGGNKKGNKQQNKSIRRKPTTITLFHLALMYLATRSPLVGKTMWMVRRIRSRRMFLLQMTV